MSEQRPYQDARPTISIVIPCFNSEAFVRQAINSALTQSYPNKEVIVIDDGSSDNSLDVIREFGGGIRSESGPNRGPGAARNRGLALATGRHVLFLDADDYLEDDLIEGLAAVISAQDTDIAFGPFCSTFPDGTRKLGRQINEKPERLLAAWLDGHFVPSCSILWRADFIRAIGGWNNIARNDDGELIYRAILSDARYALSSAGMGVYVQHDSPLRVSANHSLATFQAEMKIYQFVEDGCSNRRWDEGIRALTKAYYTLGRLAYVHNYDAIAREALSKAASLGQRGHHGTLAHRVAASILGLRTKEWLSRMLHR